MVEQLRLMAVHAHPDDESSKGAATMARYVAEGVDVLVVTCTGGERGSILNPKMDRPDVLERIGDIRRAEMEMARAILGVRQEWLGFIDSGLPEGDPLPPLPDGCFALTDLDEATEALVRSMRAFRPHVVLTYDEEGGYPHPDHIMTHKISVAAFDASGDPDRFPAAGEPWQPLKLYYHMRSKGRLVALHDEMTASGLDSPFGQWLESWDDSRVKDHRITTLITCGEYFHLRDDALRAHATQVDPDGFWFSVPREIELKVAAIEEYELVRSLVDSAIPEDDLFAGIRPAEIEDGGVPLA